MNRHYTREEFINRVLQIKDIKPDISITTDIIVGFPEETDDDFTDTLDLCKVVGFAKIHAFPFSLRKGTKAENLKPVPDKVKNDRMSKLLELNCELEANYREKYINTIHEIIIETNHKDYLVGHTSNYLEVNIPYKENLIGKFTRVKIIQENNGKLYGELL